MHFGPPVSHAAGKEPPRTPPPFGSGACAAACAESAANSHPPSLVCQRGNISVE
jgi:hypothetical protein